MVRVRAPARHGGANDEVAMRPALLRRGGGVSPLLVLAAVVATACGPVTPVPSSAVSGSQPPVAAATVSPAAATESPTSDPSVDLPADSPSDLPSDSPTDAPTPVPVDPCSLITRAEANAVAGTKTGAPLPEGDPATRCVWPTPTSGAIGQVELDVGDGAKKAYDIDATVLKHSFKPVAGLGDEAYVEDGSVFFRKGDTWVGIHIVRLDDSKTWTPKLIALAMTVAGQI
jgi:hypothetical protein